MKRKPELYNELAYQGSGYLSAAVFCVGILIVVVVQKNKLSRMHRKLQESNDSLNVLSHKLADANTHLNEVNNELVENNYIKENYVAHFIRLSSEYIGKNQKFRLEVNKALRKVR